MIIPAMGEVRAEPIGNITAEPMREFIDERESVTESRGVHVCLHRRLNFHQQASPEKR